MNRSILATIGTSLILFGCGGGNKTDISPPTDISVVTTQDGTATAHSATITPDGGTITLPTGERLVIPKGAITASSTVKILREGDTYKFTPEGLTFNTPISLSIPASAQILANAGKVLFAYIYSSASPEKNSISGRISAERIKSLLIDDLQEGSRIDLQFSHFSIIRFTIQDRIYIPLTLDSKYLKKGDIIFALSSENYTTQAPGFDWFPGHTAMILDSSKSATCTDTAIGKKCDVIESVPPAVRASRLDEDFIKAPWHIYMGARRPKAFSISTAEATSVTS